MIIDVVSPMIHPPLGQIAAVNRTILLFVLLASLGIGPSLRGQSPTRMSAADDLLGGGDLLGGDDLLGGNNLLGGDLVPHGRFHAGQADPLGQIGEPDPVKTNDEFGGKDPHEGLWVDGVYPSAEACRKCHPSQYDEWRSSGHAYSAVSPMFHKFEHAMAEYTEGTVGAFCVRCHSPVGTQLDMPRHANLLEAPPVVREGVTCIACHRIREHYGRSHGARRIEPGDIHAPVGRSGDGVALYEALANAKSLKLKPIAGDLSPGQNIHNGSYFFEPLKNSEVCVSCHQVAVHPGIWLEVVHAQYRAGPAAAKGVSCQDCHMGAVPGKSDGYGFGYCAEINGKPYGKPRRKSNHSFWGPGYSIAHPGIFPHSPKNKTFSPTQWMSFDWRAGWGTDAFESQAGSLPPGTFPPGWENADDRRDARKIVNENLATVHEKRGKAIATMEAGLKIDPVQFFDAPRIGRPMRIGYRVTNQSEGHNLPTGSLGAQPQLWLNTVLIDPLGNRVWESGYLDSNGDLADMHSVDVAKGRVKRDKYLFNLQTKFLINNIRGTDREVALPLNFSIDQLGFLRPGAVPQSVLNHPPFIRMEAHSIPPLDHRIAKYTIPANAFRHRGAYRLSVRMRSRTEPMYFMRQIGCTPEMMRRMNENSLDLSIASKTFMVR